MTMESLSGSPAAQAAAIGMDSIYGDSITEMREVLEEALADIEDLRYRMKAETGEDPVEHCLSRIKTDASMREKCRRRGLPETRESALNEIKDAIGIRIVCGFLDDLWAFRDHLAESPLFEFYEEKNYISHAKSNGYRSLHLLLRARNRYFVEIQLRTISMDSWAALEHQMHYKKGSVENEALIASELKRCADELASTDISMQTIRDMIRGEL